MFYDKLKYMFLFLSLILGTILYTHINFFSPNVISYLKFSLILSVIFTLYFFISKKNTETDEKLLHLEGLRGTAALIVVICHFIQTFYPAAIEGLQYKIHTPIESFIYNTPFTLFYSGNFAFITFFILSGFVLSYKYFVTNDSKVIMSGVIRRYPRLTLPIVFSCIISYVLIKLNLFCNSGMSGTTHTAWLEEFYKQGSLGTTVFDSFIGVYTHKPSINPVLWTMRFELIGSYIVFLVLFLFNKFNKRVLIYSIGLPLLLLIKPYLFCFLLGILLCDLHVNNRLKKCTNSFIKSLILLAGLFFASYPDPSIETNNTIYKFLKINSIAGNDLQRLYIILGSTIIIYSILNSNLLRTFFSTNIMRFFGKISFSLYITHFFILNSFSCYIFKQLIRSFPYNISVLLTLFSSIAVMMSFAFVVYKLVDINSIRLSKFVYNFYLKSRNSGQDHSEGIFADCKIIAGKNI